MQIICKDGTTIQCDDFEAIDSGVLFFQETPGRPTEAGEEDEEEEAEDRKADGFVPVTEVHFVLPDEMVQQTPQRGMQERGQMPPGAPAQQGGGVAQQQQMQQFPGGPRQSGR
ncbi:hypothetical protein NDI56_18095 [Haloarcula sp. S1CR25-12]|uniref:Uncharacterized protein n=1 Tax=Haloarcula saliterrae TaxID=2950534 RepID=A0ABU2FGC6_9EURY|nr:hypothetical protein [Haloarcula sp. S1CR25-12]MDS0261315.1 hypothetical protein [Haloarcula sp. S1CR25-12]